MIGVIDYGAGNIRSITRGLQAAGAEPHVFDNGGDLATADAIVLPGVGHAGQLMASLDALGFTGAILDAVGSGKPFLGICVGLQIMFEEQEEGGGRGLGLLSGRVVHIPKTLKTPHMGWSLATTVRSSPMGPVGQTDFFYFVHSYAVDGAEPDCVVATTSYGVTFPSVVISENLWGCQFHPEKSSAAGIRFLGHFADFVARSERQSLAAATG